MCPDCRRKAPTASSPRRSSFSIPSTKPSKTLCLEFFGPDFDEASRVILELSRIFPLPADGNEALLALEHFDDEYIRAIDYKVKAPRAETPKAALLIDIAGDSAEQASAEWSGCAPARTHPNTLLFVAQDAAEAKRFWADRKKLGAIARRTNAFKMNEDIVIPLDTLAEFARFVDAINIEEERYAQLRFCPARRGGLHRSAVQGRPRADRRQDARRAGALRALPRRVAEPRRPKLCADSRICRSSAKD